MKTTNTNMKIETTTNYALFLENVEQRAIKESHVKRIAASMRKHGFIPSKPIQCYRANGGLVVVDGHHRLNAAQMIKIPVCYVIETSKAQESMTDENEFVLRWSMLDFVQQYAVRGNPEYMEILEYANHGIPVRMAASMLSGEMAASNNVSSKLRSGTFKIKTRKHIHDVLSVIREFVGINPVVKTEKFIGALSRCLFVPEFDVKTLKARIARNPTALKSQPTWQAMVEHLERIYNHGAKAQIPLSYMVNQAMRERDVKGRKI